MAVNGTCRGSRLCCSTCEMYYIDSVFRLLVHCRCDTPQSAQDLQLMHAVALMFAQLVTCNGSKSLRDECHWSLFQHRFCCSVSWQVNTHASYC